MFADERYSGSGRIFEVTAKSPLQRADYVNNGRSRDISGYGSFLNRPDDCSESKEISAFLSLLKKCYAKLGDQDAVKTLSHEEGESAIFSQTFLLDNEDCGMESLEMLENSSDFNGGSSQAKLSICDALERAGLHNTLSSVLQGLVSSNDSTLPDEDQSDIKEKWFMCRLLEDKWDDLSLYKDSSLSNSMAKSVIPLRSSHKMRLHEIGQNSNSPGFYESLGLCLSALRDDDFDSFKLRACSARLQLIAKVSMFGPGSVSVWETLDVIDKLRVMNDLDTLSPSTDSLEGVISRTNSRMESINMTNKSSFIKFGFSSSLYEIILRSFPRKSMSFNLVADVRNHLIGHLQNEASVCTELGLRKDADAAIRRLYRIYNHERDQSRGDYDSIEMLSLQMHQAALLESKSDFTGAIRRVRHTIRILKGNHTVAGEKREALLADALLTCGSWMTKHNVEHASSVSSNYFIPAAKLSKAIYNENKCRDNTNRSIKSLLALSHLALNLFESVSNRVKSLSWQAAGEGLQERRLEISKSEQLLVDARKRAQSIKKKGSQEFNEAEREIRELQIYRIHLEREIKNTEEERKAILSSLDDHRILAMQSIVSALRLSGVDTTEDLSTCIFRFVSLWFSSEEENAWSDSVSASICEAVDSVPTFRFVPLFSQLLSRLSSEQTPEEKSSQFLLQQLVYNMCIQHPYHCVVPLIALSNGRIGGALLEKEVTVTKGDVASALVVKVKKSDQNFLFNLTENYEKLIAAYIHLAMADTKDFHRGNTSRIPLEKVCKSSSVRLDRCLSSGTRQIACPPCILSKPPEIRPGGDYGDGVEDPIGSERIASFESYFSVTEGGLHRPKIVTCLGTKGGQYRELVKGEDETRQDAVMEQVFAHVNSIMARQRVVKKQNQHLTRVLTQSELKLVTYTIVPLSPLAGVLEWVEHAIPFGDFIADKNGKRMNDIGAHSRYYPGEWGHAQCRSHLDSAPRQDKRSAYDEICSNNSPVFRYFFVERFSHSIETWYLAKTRYTRSVAVSSIVGHILGIGDRHTSNILVHQKTGEVVHIDFGIVFEQGKLLNTPEKVPFRLTRNMVDGMGVLGTEGMFTKAAEATLAALKSNSGALLTIVSAIVADPLYKWTIQSVDGTTKSIPNESKKSSRRSSATGTGTDSAKSDRRSTTNASYSSPSNSTPAYQNNDRKIKNEAAEHAIRKIHEKLQGYEDGTSGEQQSVEGQVSLLINSAKDPDNLSMMFPGWAPWV